VSKAVWPAAIMGSMTAARSLVRILEIRMEEREYNRESAVFRS
jgi:hypothetical protein